MQNIQTLYREELRQTIIDEFARDFSEASAGTCMKLSGLALEDFVVLREMIVRAYPFLKVVVLTDGDFSAEYSVTATKLIELRNMGRDPILVLIPSALQTPAEDSYGNATFKDLSISRIDDRILANLNESMPNEVGDLVKEVQEFTQEASKIDHINYLLALRHRGWDRKGVGEEMNWVGLIPDTAVPEDAAKWRTRLYYNRICSGIISDFALLVPDRVSKLPIRPETNQAVIVHFLGECQARHRIGTMCGIRNADNFAELDFAKWQIPEIEDSRQLNLRIVASEITSPHIQIHDGDKTLSLKQGQSATLKLRLTMNPSPKDFPELKVFRIMLVSTDGNAEIQEAKRAKVTSNARAYRDISIKVSAELFEEGTYYLRAYGEDEAGNVLNKEDDFKNLEVQEAWLDRCKTDRNASHSAFKAETSAKTVNETEDVYFNFSSEDQDDEGGQSENESLMRKSKLDAAYQAYFRCRLAMLKRDEELKFPVPDERSTGWMEPKGTGQQKVYRLKLSAIDNYQICISNKLFLLETELLKNGNAFGSLRCRTFVNPNHTTFDRLEFVPCPDPRLLRFADKRKKLFDLIRASASNDSGILETWLDFCRSENIELIKDYVVAYLDAINDIMADVRSRAGDASAMELVASIQNLDTVYLESPIGGGRDCSVKLMTPLHPLRLAWLVDLFELYSDWEQKTVADSSHLKEWTAETSAVFLGSVYPSNNPSILAQSASGYYQYSGEMVFGWGVWVQDGDTHRTVGLSNERQVKIHIAEQLNLPCDVRIDTDVSEEMIVRYVRNYLRQHPYADKLVVNVFNPGDGASFVRALIDLEQKSPDRYQYEFRLYCEDDFVVPGEAFRELMNPESVISEKAESFSEAAENRLFPKLRFSLNRISDYSAHAQDYTANLSFLVNPFVSRSLLVSPDTDRCSDSLNGVVVKCVSTFEKSSGDLMWNKSVFCSEGVDGARAFYHEGNRLLNSWQKLTAIVMNPLSSDVIPGTSVRVGVAERALITQIHAYSDWVVTFDKCIGPEIFDSQNNEDAYPYLLDYVPGGELSGVSAFLTTRPGIEAYRFLEPYLRESGLASLATDENMLRMLDDIRTISGSLLMQAIATDNKAFEVIGLSLTKRMLEKKGYLHGAFLIPIDLHKELFDIEDEGSKERADLLLVRLDLERRDIHLDVVEVKCRTRLSGSTEAALEDKVFDQIEHSIKAFRTHFEIGYLQGSDRIDRALKNIELRKLLEFYIERATRFCQLDPRARSGFLAFCASLDAGYGMSFGRLEIIYNFSAPHAHKKEETDQFTRYTIGKSLIDDIMDLESDLNTLRLEETLRRADPVPPCDSTLSHGNETQAIQPIDDGGDETPEVQVPVENVSTGASQQVEPETQSLAGTSESQPQEPSSDKPLTHEQTPLVHFDTLVGGNSTTRQFGLLGMQKSNKRRIALDLSETTTISLFGVQGAGKSYTIGTISEMVLKQIPNVNQLPSPLAGVIFHYSESMDYAPEFTSMNRPNDNAADVQKLVEQYKASPSAIDDIVLLTPKAKAEERKAQYPEIDVRPIAFKSSELNVKDWQFLLGAVGNDSMYIKQINSIMRNIRNNLSLEALRTEVRDSPLLTNNQKALAEQRFQFAQEYIDDTAELSSALKPGRLVIVDLRDEFIQKDEALGLFVVMLNIFSGVAEYAGKRFNKFIVFDEAHKYMDNKDLTDNIVTAIREMRHKGVSLMIASQDPPSLPSEIIELSSVVLMHKFNSPAWLKHIQKSITSLSHIQDTEMAALSPGEAFLWSNKSTDKQIETRPVKIITRPRVTKHGGATITAV